MLHERVLILAVEILEQPYHVFNPEECVTDVGQNFYRIALKFGFMDKLDVPGALARISIDGELLQVEQISFFLGKETLIPKADKFSGMAHWREHLFAVMQRNATDATKFFGLPAEQVVEMGTQLEI